MTSDGPSPRAFRKQRTGAERLPKAHILVTILFTSLAWLILDVILFATQSEGPNSHSGKLPVLDAPVRHDKQDVAKRDLGKENQGEDVVARFEQAKRRQELIQQWREENNRNKAKILEPAPAEPPINKADDLQPDVVGKAKQPAAAASPVERVEALDNRRLPEDPDANDRPRSFKEIHGVKALPLVEIKTQLPVKVENDSVVHDRILPEKAEERPKSFKELHLKMTTLPTTTKLLGDVNSFMKGWKEERLDDDEVAKLNARKKQVDALMNKIDHNAQAILERKSEDIVQFDNPWVHWVDDKTVPTEKPITISTKKPDPIPTTEMLNFTLVKDLDVSLSPRVPDGPGEGGRPVILSSYEQVLSKRTWDKNHFSLYVSDKISLERSLSDVRPKECKYEKYPYRHLPTTSIIICFTDEAWSTLIRSVHSVLNRSPPELVEEVILVDDFSTKEHLKQRLDDYIRAFPKVKILRMSKREGLIRARLAAVEVAQAPVLTFLDSHIECSVGWLEALLERIRLNPKAVPCPVIDTISDSTLQYIAADAGIRGGFSWTGLMFRWNGVPNYEKKRLKGPTDAIRSPTMAGGLFSIRKDYFYELGTYDPGLQIWGAENIELSFKVWLCGGSLEIVPCSHVGHIFRAKQPYSFPGSDNISMFLKNSLRVATVWLDDYLDAFFVVNSQLRSISAGNVTERLELKKNLKCHNFDWYLKNVYPELFVPGFKLRGKGELVNVWTQTCLDSKGNGLNAGVGYCHKLGGNQNFRLTENDTIEVYEECLSAPDNQNIRPIKCSYPDAAKWNHVNGGYIKDKKHGRCLEVMADQRSLQLTECKENFQPQQWSFSEYS